MNFKSVYVSKLDFFHLVKTIFAEAIYCLAIFYCYAIFSMLFFGEGANSFMYTPSNGFIYLGLIILPPSILNFYKFDKYYKNGELSKSKNYLLTEGILVIGFILLLIYQSPMTF